MTETVQVPKAPLPLLARAGTEAPLIDRVELPGVAVREPPLQVLDALAGLAMISCEPALPIGRLSVKLALVSGCAERLVNVAVSRETDPS